METFNAGKPILNSHIERWSTETISVRRLFYEVYAKQHVTFHLNSYIGVALEVIVKNRKAWTGIRSPT